MKTLVTGGTGFVGRHLVRALIEKDTHIRLLVRKTSNIEEFKNIGVELVHGDITERDSLHGIAKGINIVYHLAASGHVSAISQVAYQRFFDVNVKGTNNLAEECGNSEVDRFIHFSSTAALGLIKKPLVDETMLCQPSTPYQRSKYEGEKAVEKYWRERGLPTVILRPCMIYGEGGKGEFLKICRLIQKKIFPKIGKGKNLMPIVHVKDVVQAALLAEHKGKPGETYLIASNKSYELNEIRKLITKYLGINGPYFYIPYKLAKFGAYWLEIMAKLIKFTPIVTSKNIESTVTDRVFSISKAVEELGYIPKVELECGIKETLAWFKNKKYL